MIPTESFHGHRITASDDCILYQISEDKVAKVSALGRVTGVVQMKGYGKIRDFSYDGYDEVYWLGKKKKMSIYWQHLSRQGTHGLCTGLRKIFRPVH